jgi:preprotein translocase subunit SecE
MTETRRRRKEDDGNTFRDEQGKEETEVATTRQQETAGGSLWRELFSFSIYKRNQGKVARQVTFAALAVALLIGVWRLSQLLPIWFGGGAASGAGGLGGIDLGVLRLGVPIVLGLLALWFSVRIVNVPRFADFLISVESEMTKVSWPSKDEVIRSSAVVIFLIFALAAILAGYDLFWWSVLRSLQGFN